MLVEEVAAERGEDEVLDTGGAVLRQSLAYVFRRADGRVALHHRPRHRVVLFGERDRLADAALRVPDIDEQEQPDRGRLAPAMAADVVVFDPATVQDTATYDNPFQYPAGIDAVIVNGKIALRDGGRSDDHHGRSLKAGA